MEDRLRRWLRARGPFVAGCLALLIGTLVHGSDVPGHPIGTTGGSSVVSWRLQDGPWQPDDHRCHPRRHRKHPLPTSLSLAVDVGLGRAGSPVRIVATLPGRFSGKLVFSEGGRRLGSQRLRDSRRAVLTTTAFGAGLHTVTARFKGRGPARCQPSASVTFVLTGSTVPGGPTDDRQNILATIPVGTIIVSMPTPPPDLDAELLDGWLDGMVVIDARGGRHPWAVTTTWDAGTLTVTVL